MAILDILPMTAKADKGNLSIAGCDLRDLVNQFGTPLYVYDEHTIRTVCNEFTSHFPDTRIFYASKAWLSLALVRILVEEGVGVDVVSGGELHTALSGGMPPEMITMNGNAKTEQELTQALEAGISRIIVDNMDELRLLNSLTTERKKNQTVMMRITPNVDAHTHEKTTTGLVDSKFGFPISGNQVSEAAAYVMDAPYIDLSGFHAHLGSPIYNTEPYKRGIHVLARLAASMRSEHGYEWREFSVGGGFAIGYTDDRLPPDIHVYAEVITGELQNACKEYDLNIPELHIEPGRSVVGRAGVAVYSIISRKHIPDTRDYISVDGGMADNIRFAMYGSQYAVCAPEFMDKKPKNTVTIAGKYCETGDVLIRDAELPDMEVGDIIAVPASGAYHVSMESNYNMALCPAIVMVRDGSPTLIRRRQTYNDLLELECNL